MQGVQEFLEKPIAGGIFAQITYKLVIEIVIALIVGAAVGVMLPGGGGEQKAPEQTINNHLVLQLNMGCNAPCQYRSPYCPYMYPIRIPIPNSNQTVTNPYFLRSALY